MHDMYENFILYCKNKLEVYVVIVKYKFKYVPFKNTYFNLRYGQNYFLNKWYFLKIAPCFTLTR